MFLSTTFQIFLFGNLKKKKFVNQSRKNNYVQLKLFYFAKYAQSKSDLLISACWYFSTLQISQTVHLTSYAFPTSTRHSSHHLQTSVCLLFSPFSAHPPESSCQAASFTITVSANSKTRINNSLLHSLKFYSMSQTLASYVHVCLSIHMKAS